MIAPFLPIDLQTGTWSQKGITIILLVGMVKNKEAILKYGFIESHFMTGCKVEKTETMGPRRHHFFSFFFYGILLQEMFF